MNAHKNLSLWLALCLGLFLFTTGSAFAAVGDIAIFTETTGGDPIAMGASIDQNWDNTFRNSGTAFGYTADSTEIDLNEAGHYLAIYNSLFNSAGGAERREIQSQLILDAGGTADPLSTGWSQGYIRRQNDQNEAITAGGGIFNIDSPGTLSLRSTRTDAENNALTRAPAASGMQLLKLDDSWDYLRLTRAADQAGPTNTTWVDVAYDTQDEYDTGSFTHALGSGDITLNTAGHYLVFANTYNDMTNHDDTRTLANQRLTLDGALIPGTQTTTYMRGGSNGDNCFQGSASIGTIIETTAADQILNVELMLDTGNGTKFIGGKTAITIARLPDDGDYIRLDDSGAQDFNPAAKTPINWDTELELDTAGFTHSTTTDNSQIGAVEDDDYLFLSAMFDDDDAVQRGYYWQRWELDGSGAPLEFGQTGQYARNTGGADDVGNWSGAILGMTGGQYVESVSQAIGNSGILTADIQGLQGVRLSSIFSQAAELVWLGGTGNWTVANWTGDVAPAGGENHIITTTAVASVVQVNTARTGDQAANALTMDNGTLSILTGGTLEVAGGPGTQISGPAVLSIATGGLLDTKKLIIDGTGVHTFGAGAGLTVSSALTVDTTLDTTGATLVTDGAGITVAGTFTADNALNAAGVDVAGTMNAAALTIDGDVNVTGTLVMTGLLDAANVSLDGTKIEAAGVTAGGELALDSGELNVGANAINADELLVLTGSTLTRTGSVSVADLTLSNGGTHAFTAPALLTVTGDTVVDGDTTLNIENVLGGANVTVSGAATSLDASGATGADAIDVTGEVGVANGGTLIVNDKNIIADTVRIQSTGFTRTTGGITAKNLILNNFTANVFGAGSLNILPGGVVEVDGVDTTLESPDPTSVATLKIVNGGALTGPISATDDYLLENAALNVRVVGLPDAAHPDTLLAAANITALGGTVDLNKRVYSSGFLAVEGGTTNVNAAPSGELHTIGGEITVDAGATLNTNGEIAATSNVVIVGMMNLNADLTTTSTGLGLQTVVLDQLNQSIIFGIPRNDSSLNLDGATYQASGTRIFTGDKANTVLTMADSHSGMATSEINAWNTFPTFNGGAEDFVTAFSGLFIPSESGTYTIEGNHDDRGLSFIDIGDDGVFDNADRMGATYDNDGDASWPLVAGEAYKFIIMAHEHGGGQSNNWYITPPGGARDRINPADPTGNGGAWASVAEYDGAVAVFDGGTLTIDNSAVLNTANVAVDAGSTINVNDGSIDAVWTSIDGTLNLVGALALADGATFESPVTVNAGGTLDVQTAQTNPSQMHIEGYGFLQGDLTGMSYATTATAGKISFDDNALLADGITGLAQPLPADIGGRKLLIPILTSTDAPTNVIGVAANAFKGAYFGAPYGGGDFTGTLTNEALSAENLLVTLDTSVTFGGATLASDTLTTQVNVLDGSTLTLKAGGYTGNLIVTGQYDPVDGSGMNNTGTGIVRLDNLNAVGDGQTVTVEKGVVDTRTEDVLHANGTLNIGQYAGLVMHDNPGESRRADNIRQGNVNIQAGGWVQTNNNNRFTIENAVWTFDPDSYVYLDAEINVDTADPNFVDGVNKGFDDVNLIITDDRYRQGLWLGAGKRLTTPANQSANTDVFGGNMQEIGKSLSNDPTTPENIAAGLDYVILSGANNSTLDIRTKVLLAGVDLLINDPIGTILHLPDSDGNHQMQAVDTHGWVEMDASVLECDDIIVRNGSLRLGGSRDMVATITGEIHVWDGAQLRLDAQRGGTDVTKLRQQFTDGTAFPGGINVDSGGYLRVLYHQAALFNTQAITYLNTGDVPDEGPGYSTLYADEEGGGGNYEFRNITVQHGVILGIDRKDVNEDQLRLRIYMEGDMNIQRRPDNCSLLDLLVDADNQNLVVGRLEDGGGDNSQFVIRGVMGLDKTDGVTHHPMVIDVLGAGIELHDGAVVTAGTVINHVQAVDGSTSQNAQFKLMIGDNDPVTGNRTAHVQPVVDPTVVINLGGFGNGGMRFQVDDVDAGEQRVEYTYAGIINTIGDGDATTYDARISTDNWRGTGAPVSDNGVITIGQGLILDADEAMYLRSWDNVTLITSMHVAGTGTNAFVGAFGNERINLTDITGDHLSNTLTLVGDSPIRLQGGLFIDVVNEKVYHGGTNRNSRVWLETGFDLNGHTLTLNANKDHRIYGDITNTGVGGSIVKNNGDDLRIDYGQDGAAWTGTNVVIDFTDNSGVRIGVMDADPDTDPQIVNDVKATFNIAAGLNSFDLRGDRITGPDTGNNGKIQVDTVNIGDNSRVELHHDDGTETNILNLTMGDGSSVDMNGSDLVMESLGGTGSGFDDGGSVTISGTGQVSPGGDGTGTLAIGSVPFIMSTGATYMYEVAQDGTNDLVAAGDLTLAAFGEQISVEVATIGSAAFLQTDTLPLFTYSTLTDGPDLGGGDPIVDTIALELADTVGPAGPWASAEVRTDGSTIYLTNITGAGDERVFDSPDGVWQTMADWNDGVGAPAPAAPTVFSFATVNSGIAKVQNAAQVAADLTIGGTGTVNIKAAGALTVNRAVTVSTGGALSVAGSLTTNELEIEGGTVNAAADVTIAKSFTSGTFSIGAEAGSFKVAGNNLQNTAPSKITLDGGRVTVKEDPNPGALPGGTSQIALWNFDSGDASDSSIGGADYTGTVVTPDVVTFVPEGVFGGAAHFDGSVGKTDAGISLPAGFDDFTGGITISYWAKDELPRGALAGSSEGSIIGLSNGADVDSIAIDRYQNDASPDFTLYNEDDARVLFGMDELDAYKLGEWRHITFTVDVGAIGEATARCYVNGVLAFESDTHSLPKNILRGTNFLGRNSFSHSLPFTGWLDEIAVYDRALTPAEIVAIGGSGPLDLGDTDVLVTVDSTLANENAVTTFGDLSVADDVTLTLDPFLTSTINFGGLTMGANATVVGDTTYSGALSQAAGTAATLSGESTFTSPLTVAAGNTLTATTLNANAGLAVAGTLTATTLNADAGLSVAGTLVGTTLNVDGGLSLAATSTVSGGTMTVAGGTSTIVAGSTIDVGQLNLAGGTNAIADGASVQVGEFKLSGGDTTLASGDVAVTQAAVTGGTHTLNGNSINVTKKVTVGDVPYGVKGGTLTASDLGTVATNDLLARADLTLSGVDATLSIGSPAIPDGAMGAWLFDDPGNLGLDSTGNGYDGILRGDPTAAVGVAGGAIDLDGDGDYVEMPYPDAFNTDAVTVSAWISVEAFDKDWQAIVARGEGTHWRMARSGSSNNVNMCEAGSGGALTTTDVNDGAWYHLVGVRTATETEIWVNGVLESEDTDGAVALATSNNPVMIGNNPNQTGRTFEGLMDDVVIFDRKLTVDDVADLWNDGEGLASGPVNQITTNLVIADNATLTSGAPDVTLGNLTVAPGVTAVKLDGAAYSVADASMGNVSTLDGELAVRGTLNIGTGVGTMTVASTSDLTLDTGGTFNAQVSLANLASLAADKIVIAAEGPEGAETDQGNLDLSLGGMTAMATGRTDSAAFTPTTLLTVIDNEADAVNGVGTFLNGSVPPDDTHIGQGAFLRDVITEGVIPITAVKFEVVVAREGDTDGDGLMGLDDWDAFRANFGSSGAGWTEGNFDSWSDDIVDLDDWDIFRNRFGETYNIDGGGAAAAAVPEPGTLVMLLAGVAGLAVLGWRRARRGLGAAEPTEAYLS